MGPRRVASLSWLCVMAVAAATLLAVAPAAATLIVRLTDVTDISNPVFVECADGDGCDSDPTTGAVAFGGTVGGFDFNSLAVRVGGPALAELALQADVTTSGDGFLSIEASDNGFNVGAGGATLRSVIEGTTDSPDMAAAVPRQCVSGSDIAFDCAEVDIVHGLFDGAFSDTATAALLLGGDFSITEEIFLLFAGGGSASVRFVSQVEAEVEASVTEPSALLLLGTGLTALAASAYPRRARTRPR